MLLQLTKYFASYLKCISILNLKAGLGYPLNDLASQNTNYKVSQEDEGKIKGLYIFNKYGMDNSFNSL